MAVRTRNTRRPHHNTQLTAGPDHLLQNHAVLGASANGFVADPFSGHNDLVPPPTPSGLRNPDDGLVPFVRTIVGSHTLTNHGKGSENQDAMVSSCSASGSKSLVGVFDGHGEQGKRVSEFVATQIARSLFSHKELHSDPVAALESAFLDTQQKIERTHNFDAFHSGTTAVAAYRHRNRLFVANVGDSRAVLGCGTGSKDPSSVLKAIELSSDHRPDREDERRRVLAEGGTVHQSAIPVRQGFGDAPRFVRVGPERVWDRTGRCGLCVTRSLGDLSMRPWVIATPEVTERELTPADKLIVLGSDGVWDRMSSQEAVDIAARHRDPAAAAREISSVARQRWHQQTQGQMSDDITAVVVHLDFSSPPSPPPTPGGGPHGAAERLPSTGGLRRGRGKVPPEAVLRKDPPQRIGSRANSASGGPRPAALFGTPADFPLQSSTSKPAATAAATGLERLPPMAAPTPARQASRQGRRR